jgi:hypothetical protein
MVERTPLLGRPPGRLLLTLCVGMPDMVLLLWYGTPSCIRRRKFVLPYYTIRRMPVVPAAAASPWTNTASAEFARLRKTSAPWLTGVASTGTSTLVSAAAAFFFPLSFFAIGGGQSEVQVAVQVLAKQGHRKWRSGCSIAIMHTISALVSFLRDVPMAKGWYSEPLESLYHRNRVRGGAKGSYTMW